jgi:hypothetical protein
MTAVELLADLQTQGIIITVRGEKLSAKASAPIPTAIVDLIQAHKPALIQHLKANLRGTDSEGGSPVETKQSDTDLFCVEQVEQPEIHPTSGESPDDSEAQNDVRPEASLDDHRALAVDFLEAVEALLVTVKDERPPSFRTPNLKRDLNRLEGELTAWRAVLIPDNPESHATGDSLAEQYRARGAA